MTALTKRIKSKFLKALEENGGIVTDAARIVPVSRQALYYQREVDKKFAEAWDRAVDLGINVLEDEAKRRALEGTPEPVFYQGEVCGTIMKKSDALMIRILGAHRERYKNKTELSSDPDNPVTFVINTKLPGMVNGKHKRD